MPEENEKGFVIKDKRAINKKGNEEGNITGDETGKPKTADPGGETQKKEAKETPSRESVQMPLPEITFPSLIFSLSSTALFHLGELPDPQTNEKKKDLPLAKHAIDTIAMLKEKTAGNLTDDEEKFIVNVLTDIRLRYVKEKG